MKPFTHIISCCDKSCHLNAPLSLQENEFNKFMKLTNHTAQSRFLFNRITVSSTGKQMVRAKQKLFRRLYFLLNESGEEIMVCKRFFKSLFLISDGRIDRILKTNNYEDICDKRGRHAAVNKISEERIREVLESIPELQGCVDSSQQAKINVYNSLKTGLLYNTYKTTSPNPVCKTTFRNIIRGTLLPSTSPALTKTNADELERDPVNSIEGATFENCVLDQISNTTRNTTENEKHRIEENGSGDQRSSGANNWTRNKRKVLRNQGLAYVSTTGKLVPAKEFHPISHCCVLHCHRNFPDALQIEIFNQFYAATFDEQNALIFNIVKVLPIARHSKAMAKQSTRKMYTRKYFLRVEDGSETSVCKHLFRSLLAVSDGRIDRVLKSKLSLDVDESSSMTPPKDKRGRHVPGNKTPQQYIDALLKILPHLNIISAAGQRRNVKSLYKDYLEITNDVPVTESVFRRVFKEHF